MQIEDIKDLLKLVKIVPLLENYSDIKPSSGIRHQLAGIGTNEKDKQVTLSDKNKQGLETALRDFFKEGLEFLDKQ